jgi:hypothetical protein
MTPEQISAFLDWSTQVTHALVEMPKISHTAKLNILDAVRDLKLEFGEKESVGEPE